MLHPGANALLAGGEGMAPGKVGLGDQENAPHPDPLPRAKARVGEMRRGRPWEREEVESRRL